MTSRSIDRIVGLGILRERVGVEKSEPSLESSFSPFETQGKQSFLGCPAKLARVS